MSSKINRKRKRKNNVKIPHGIFQNESLEVVASIAGPIITAPVTLVDKEILLDRLKIELLDRCAFFTSNVSPARGDRRIIDESGSKMIHKCLIVGTNECTRALEAAKKKCKNEDNTHTQNHFKPSLIILSRDLRPPTILAHIPFLCKQLDVPIVLLPGKASSDLGKLLQMKTAAVILLCTLHESYEETYNKSEREVSNKIKSFAKFAKSKIPSSFDKANE